MHRLLIRCLNLFKKNQIFHFHHSFFTYICAGLMVFYFELKRESGVNPGQYPLL